MKTKWNVVVLVVAALLAGAPVTQAAAPKSIAGTWKVKSAAVCGKATDAGGAMYAKGTVWKLNKNGSAATGSYDDWKWSYDADAGDIVLRRKGFLWEVKHTYSVTSQGNDIKFTFYILGLKWEVVLTPD